MPDEAPIPTPAGVDLAARWGASLRTARLEAGLSQAQLAARARTHAQAVQQFESGQRVPLDHMKVALALALDLTPGILFAWPPINELVA